MPQLAPVLFLFLLALISGGSTDAGQALAQVSTEVPAKAWRAAALRNLPESAALTVVVEADGPLEVVFLPGREADAGVSDKPLFRGLLTRQIRFTLIIPRTGDYFVALHNVDTDSVRKVTVTVHGSTSRERVEMGSLQSF